ncbi:hypothetical protein AKJ62_01975 [candidate division MSBL1 archaeon SCGC-AAA259D14]|uniref:Uncharacterized protein n=1 Tax=candidate division MSBL1 archaeon SCGC-AAA259D14 TaxID=1698261 RepID=A0A133U6Y7_9EURY|nr:hypothetical protein AKJ62_01975 [candidate division MSBL1 archaeon SCGC-AAA259D14]
MTDDDSVDWEKLNEEAKSTYEPPYIPAFSETRVIGNTAKEIVRTLLSGSEYLVYPFGYESYFTGIKDLVHQGKFDDTPTPKVVKKIRSMPDLVVIDEEIEQIDLVEVKFRNEVPTDISLKPKIVKRYEKCWPESTLVCVTPYKNPENECNYHFYFCKINEIREKARDTSYWPEEDDDYEGIVDVEFTESDRLEHCFPNLSKSKYKENLEKMGKFVRNILKDWSEKLKK